MKKSKIYTKTGDKGETSLVGGQRILKCSDRIELYGEVDELNSYIGVAISLGIKNKELESHLLEIQKKLFNLGSVLACISDEHDKFNLHKISQIDVDKIEESIDNLNQELPVLKNFILPGGTTQSVTFELIRRLCCPLAREKLAEENLVLQHLHR